MRTFFASLALLCLISAAAQSQNPPAATVKTQVVVLGTGTPIPDPERSGPAVAVVVNGTSYLVDFGPGVVRRAVAAFQQKHTDGLQPAKLRIAFATHLDADHTAGLSDLYLTPAVIARAVPLELYGPPGIADMAHHIKAAYAKYIPSRPEAFEINVHEIKPGVVYKDDNVTVTAFAVAHGARDYSYGYIFQTADRKVVISGDTGPTDSVAAACAGCDLMLHEVYSVDWFAAMPAARQKYHSVSHTSTAILAATANKAKPKLLVLYHQLYKGQDPDKTLIEELRKFGYTAQVSSAHDLDVF